MPRIIGYGAFASVALAAYEYTGGTLKGYLNRPEVDEYERKEMLRQSRRRPIEETLAEIGEGRGESPCCTTRRQVCCDCRSLAFFQVSGRRDMRSGGERESRRSTASTSTLFAPTPMLPKGPQPWLAAGFVHIAEDRLASHFREWKRLYHRRRPQGHCSMMNHHSSSLRKACLPSF